MKHPIQPLVKDEHGVIRFKENKIVRYLLDNGGVDLNQIIIQKLLRRPFNKWIIKLKTHQELKVTEKDN